MATFGKAEGCGFGGVSVPIPLPGGGNSRPCYCVERMTGLAAATNTRSATITGINSTTVCVIPLREALSITSKIRGMTTPTPTIAEIVTPMMTPMRFV